MRILFSNKRPLHDDVSALDIFVVVFFILFILLAVLMFANFRCRSYNKNHTIKMAYTFKRKKFIRKKFSKNRMSVVDEIINPTWAGLF